MALGLYVHVPFCRARCHFCAFYLRIFRDADAARYADALVREIDLHADANTLGGRALDTVYFGGGTPTVLTPAQLTTILARVRDRLGVKRDAEVTIEAHPEDLTRPLVDELSSAGFTRLSIGMQSDDDAALLSLGRPAAARRVIEAMAHARAAGFHSVSLDLMYGLPGQPVNAWQDALESALALAPDHLSCYAFTVESKSLTGWQVARGDIGPPSADCQDDMDRLTVDRLAAAGYERYEISNWARPGHRCRHNLLYWTGRDYLGLGPSAQSYVAEERFGVIANLDAYCRSLEAGALPIVERERLTDQQRTVEVIVFGLRRIEGIDHTVIARGRQTGALSAGWLSKLEGLLTDGFLERSGERLRLTDSGRRYADTVAERLF